MADRRVVAVPSLVSLLHGDAKTLDHLVDSIVFAISDMTVFLLKTFVLARQVFGRSLITYTPLSHNSNGEVALKLASAPHPTHQTQ